ncbi:hypothetical protein PMAYCL1PPCAC_16543 [Pristionchus mayeri]|uniref:Acyl-CoA thioesterase-like C-terminal domain-containing protein n=1 Tax=Pristionchus mayeri TaxID=1317129 RepID=A0AAN5HZC9_9BILA|nr:hypothetical protein PMAYCL1PPCAC_16543 [Pristionchus mayeri]
MVVFASDTTPGVVTIRPHKKRELALVCTLDHIIHFHHHDIRADEWLLYEVEAICADAGRGFGRGRIWSADGQLLVSVTQEILLRAK